MKRKSRLDRQIRTILAKYAENPARYKQMESASEYRRARALEAAFPISDAIDLRDPVLSAHCSLLVNADPDLLNFTAEAVQFFSPADAQSEPSYLPRLRDSIASRKEPTGSTLASDAFFKLLYRINDLKGWKSLLLDSHIETFDGVFQQELDQVAVSRWYRGIPRDGDPAKPSNLAEDRGDSTHLTGIALSGGNPECYVLFGRSSVARSSPSSELVRLFVNRLRWRIRRCVADFLDKADGF